MTHLIQIGLEHLNWHPDADKNNFWSGKVQILGLSNQYTIEPSSELSHCLSISAGTPFEVTAFQKESGSPVTVRSSPLK